MPCYGVDQVKAPGRLSMGAGHLRQGIFKFFPSQFSCKMNETHPTASEDAMCLAYGRQVKELLTMSTPTEMAEHLWEIYSGFQSFEKESGYNPRQLNIFLTFRELIHFCKRIEEVKAA